MLAGEARATARAGSSRRRPGGPFSASRRAFQARAPGRRARTPVPRAPPPADARRAGARARSGRGRPGAPGSSSGLPSRTAGRRAGRLRRCRRAPRKGRARAAVDVAATSASPASGRGGSSAGARSTRLQQRLPAVGPSAIGHPGSCAASSARLRPARGCSAASSTRSGGRRRATVGTGLLGPAGSTSADPGEAVGARERRDEGTLPSSAICSSRSGRWFRYMPCSIVSHARVDRGLGAREALGVRRHAVARVGLVDAARRSPRGELRGSGPSSSTDRAPVVITLTKSAPGADLLADGLADLVGAVGLAVHARGSPRPARCRRDPPAGRAGAGRGRRRSAWPGAPPLTRGAVGAHVAEVVKTPCGASRRRSAASKWAGVPGHTASAPSSGAGGSLERVDVRSRSGPASGSGRRGPPTKRVRAPSPASPTQTIRPSPTSTPAASRSGPAVRRRGGRPSASGAVGGRGRGGEEDEGRRAGIATPPRRRTRAGRRGRSGRPARRGCGAARVDGAGGRWGRGR